MKRIRTVFAFFFVLFLLTAQVYAQSEKMDLSNENKSLSEIGAATDNQNNPGANQLQAAQQQDTNNAATQTKTEVSGIPNPQSLQNMTRANDIIGKTITNQNGEDIGRVHDLILNPDGAIVYAIVGYGGVAGVGDKLVPVPWSSLQTKVGPKTDRIIANINKETLEKAPQFEDKKWPNFAESDWVNKVRDYFNGNDQKNISKDHGDNAVSR